MVKRARSNKRVGNRARKPATATTAMVIPRPMKRVGGERGEDYSRLNRHVNMILDPCNAELGPNAYRGSDGIVSRFRNVQAIGATAGKTGFVFMFYPAYNAIYAINLNSTDNTAFSANIPGPGQAYLLANGASQRCIAACSSISYTGTELDKSGILYAGVVPASSVVAAKTVAEVAMLLQHEARVGDAPLEVKWSPTSVEEEYWLSGPAAPANLDRNVIVIIGLGFNPATTSTNFSIINTLIAEWKPEPGLGLAEPNPNSHDVPGGIEKVRSVISKLGSWWYGAAQTAYKAINSPAGKAVQGLIATML